MIRIPAVAGQFYPSKPFELTSLVRTYLKNSNLSTSALLAISPHAGYIYSGMVVGHVLGRVNIPGRVVIVGPNHRGLGAQVAVMSHGYWQTPLGKVELDQALGDRLKQESYLIKEDSLAHRDEHSLEVQLPFLQVLNPNFKLLPLCLKRISWLQCKEIGYALGRAIKAEGSHIFMVASSDMSHYESAAVANTKDSLAIKRILALDPQGLYQTVYDLDISMCGILPVTICLIAALELGASRAEQISYAHSGIVTGDYRQVVGYAGLLIK